MLLACQLGDGHMDAAAELLPACRPLRFLAIEDNVLSGAGVVTLLGALGRRDGACELEALSMRGSFDACAAVAATGLGASMARFCERQSGLARLDLSETQADSTFLARFAPALARLPRLRELALASNDVNGAGVAALAALPHLRRLDLTGNALLTLRGLVRAIRVGTVRELNLSHNRVSVCGLNRLARSPVVGRVLEKLVLSDNALRDTAMRALGLVMRAAPVLTHLDLASNHLTDLTLLHLVRCSLSIRQRVVLVDMQGNDLSQTWRGVANGSKHTFLM